MPAPRANHEARGGMLLGTGGADRHETAPKGRVCQQVMESDGYEVVCGTVLSQYNFSDRCNAHAGARSADKRLMRPADDIDSQYEPKSKSVAAVHHGLGEKPSALESPLRKRKQERDLIDAMDEVE
jgi:hypothetical protein